MLFCVTTYVYFVDIKWGQVGLGIVHTAHLLEKTLYN